MLAISPGRCALPAGFVSFRALDACVVGSSPDGRRSLCHALGYVSVGGRGRCARAGGRVAGARWAGEEGEEEEEEMMIISGRGHGK